MREGQYSFSAPKKRQDLVELGDEYKVLSIQTGVNFSRLVFNAMQYYKENKQGVFADGKE